MKTVRPQIRRQPSAPSKRTAAATANIDLQIECVALHGFSRSDGHRVTAGLQQELARLLNSDNFSPVSGSAEFIDAGRIDSIARRPELTGARIANAIYGGLQK